MSIVSIFACEYLTSIVSVDSIKIFVLVKSMSKLGEMFCLSDEESKY